MHQTTDDTSLWDAFLRNDRDAFGTLYTRHYSLLFQYGCKLSRDRSIVEDCIQELFTDIWRNKTSTPTISVRAYLLKALKYKILRQLGKPVLQSIAENDANGCFEWSHEDFIIDKDEQLRKVNQVKNALDQLSARQKEIVYLKYYQDLSYEEVSTIMNINYQVARNLLYQAIKSMKKLIGQIPLLFL